MKLEHERAEMASRNRGAANDRVAVGIAPAGRTRYDVPPAPGCRRVIRTALQVAFWLALGVWSYLLVRPTIQQAVDALTEWSDLLPYLVAKCLHLTGYAAFAAGSLALFRRRWWVLGAVAAHAVLSEVAQYLGNEWFATGRVGSVKDVLLDWFGMSVGVGVWWAGGRLVKRAARNSGVATTAG
jgi:hypothetical protein